MAGAGGDSPPAMPADPDCLFWKIVAGVCYGRRLRTNRTVTFMDINPATAGHALVVPREHSPDLPSVPEEDLEACSRAAQRLAGKANDLLGADGVNLLNPPAAPRPGRSVFHFHVHVVPRYDDDPLELPGRRHPATRTRSRPLPRSCRRDGPRAVAAGAGGGAARSPHASTSRR